MRKAARPTSTRRGSRGRVELREELARAHDRARDEVREEREVDGELAERDRPEVAAVDVDDVAEGLEREERDADRQRHLEHRVGDVAGRRPPSRVLQRRDEEVVVLEEAEDAEVAGHRDDEQRLAPRRVAGAVDGDAEHLVAERRRGQQEAEAPVPPAVEDVAGDQDEGTPARRVLHEQPAQRQHHEEEDRERDGREQHAASLSTTPAASGDPHAGALALRAASGTGPAPGTAAGRGDGSGATRRAASARSSPARGPR